MSVVHDVGPWNFFEPQIAVLRLKVLTSPFKLFQKMKNEKLKVYLLSYWLISCDDRVENTTQYSSHWQKAAMYLVLFLPTHMTSRSERSSMGMWLKMPAPSIVINMIEIKIDIKIRLTLTKKNEGRHFVFWMFLPGASPGSKYRLWPLALAWNIKIGESRREQVRTKKRKCK